VAQTLLV